MLRKATKKRKKKGSKFATKLTPLRMAVGKEGEHVTLVAFPVVGVSDAAMVLFESEARCCADIRR